MRPRAHPCQVDTLFFSSCAGLTRASMPLGRKSTAQHGLPGQARQRWEKVDFNSIRTCASLLDVAAYKMIACRGTWPQHGATGFRDRAPRAGHWDSLCLAARGGGCRYARLFWRFLGLTYLVPPPTRCLAGLADRRSRRPLLVHSNSALPGAEGCDSS